MSTLEERARESKFKLGQVVMFDRPGKRSIPMKILEVIADADGVYFYRFDRRNCVHENMVREMNNAERGRGDPDD